VLVLSEDTKRSVINHLGADPDRIMIVPPGIGIEPEPEHDPTVDPASSFALDGPFFLYPAITYPHKNHLLLLAAFARVVARRPEVLLVLTGGEAQDEGAVMAAIDELGIRDNVRRLGRIPRSDLVWLYRKATALTFPSRFEGFGIPVLEAMAHACPVLAADATALPEVVGGAGMLLPPEDPDAWAEAMLQVLDDHALRSSLRVRGAHHAAAFSWPAATAKLLAAYRRAVEVGDPARR
jgi:alpha-1,3-rhamnosyl/mannosyltransferase